MLTFGAPSGREVVAAVFFGEGKARMRLGQRLNQEISRASRRAAWAVFVSRSQTEAELRLRLKLPTDPAQMLDTLNQPMLARLLLVSPHDGWTLIRGYLRNSARAAAAVVSHRG